MENQEKPAAKRTPAATRPARRTAPAKPTAQAKPKGAKNAGRAAGESAVGKGAEGTAAEGKGGPVNSSIQLNSGILRRSKQHAKSLGVASLKEYAENALVYFVKNGLDPTEQVHSQELGKEVVRLRNHIFSFLQKQEQAYILPMFRELTGQGSSTEASLQTLIGQLEKVYGLMFRIQQMVQMSTSTTLFASGLEAGQIEEVKAKNKEFIEAQMREFSGGQGDTQGGQ